MGWSESCKTHPSLDGRSPGVCPCCLRERLSLLYQSPEIGRGHRRNASESAEFSLKKMSSTSASVSSMTGFVPRSQSHRFFQVNTGEKVNQKKRGFWSKLISGKKIRNNTHAQYPFV